MVVVGVAAMRRKARSAPMQSILAALCERGGRPEPLGAPPPPPPALVLVLDEDTLLRAPVDAWPRVDVLVAFHSPGYPLDKVAEYAARVRPALVVNDLRMQRVMLDRRDVFDALRAAGVPQPRTVFCSRDRGDAARLVGDTLHVYEPAAEPSSTKSNSNSASTSTSTSTSSRASAAEPASLAGLAGGNDSSRPKQTECLLRAGQPYFADDSTSSTRNVAGAAGGGDGNSSNSSLRGNSATATPAAPPISSVSSVSSALTTTTTTTAAATAANAARPQPQPPVAHRCGPTACDQNSYCRSSAARPSPFAPKEALSFAESDQPGACCCRRGRHHQHDLQSHHSDHQVQRHFSPPRRARTITKPFVEKPVDADDHSVYVYYPERGVRQLFRKTNNQSSRFVPDAGAVRTSGSYIYQEFHQPEGLLDIKVYAVAATYVYAESRKAPTVDGRVERTSEGLEVRHVVALTDAELEMCKRVARVFGQFIVGFDMLRAGNVSYIIDVNGWSFVKGYPEFARTAGRMLADFIVEKLAERDVCSGKDDSASSEITSRRTTSSLPASLPGLLPTCYR